jgi:hypothetical protein
MYPYKRLIPILFYSILPLLIGVTQARAEDDIKLAQTQTGSVTISSPEDGARLKAGQPITLSYRVLPGPQGDHVHVYVDGDEVAILRELEGNFVLDPLPLGRHELAIKVVNRGHVPIGVESAIHVEVR